MKKDVSIIYRDIVIELQDNNRYKLSTNTIGGVCMKGSIGYDQKSKRYYVPIWDNLPRQWR